MLAGAVRPLPPPGSLAHSRGCRRFSLWVVLLVVLSGCTYAREEPGLFSQRESDSPSPPVRQTLSPPESTNRQLPVAGDTEWTSADGLSVQTRISVHAIRRMPGATVLDWSVTPISAPGLRDGDPLPTSVDLGLTRETFGDVSITLVDRARAAVYRPLSHSSRREFQHCLCTPLWLAQLSLRVGETRLLQVSYPELPRAVQALDVDMATLPPFVQVPVTRIGAVPSARRAVDLTRPPEPSRPSSSQPVRFSAPEGQTRRMQSITIERVLASPGQTAVVWTLTSQTDQPGFGRLPADPPVARRLPDSVLTPSQLWASGPLLRLVDGDRRTLGAEWMTSKVEGPGYVECRCTPLGLWALALRERGGQLTVTTNFPPLPAGTATVDVVLPGAGRVRALPVTEAVSADRTGPPRPAALRADWVYVTDNPPRGWQTSEWPTPLPASTELDDYVSTVDAITDLPS